jgi:thiol:disulfide interchange protein
MKNKIIVPLVLLVALTFSAFTGTAQEGRKIIAVINKADWCPVCQSNGEKMMKEVMPVFEQSVIQFVMNDLTNETTKTDSKVKLNEVKVFDAVKKINATGLLILVDVATGKVLEKISVAEPVEKLIMTIRQKAMIEKK